MGWFSDIIGKVKNAVSGFVADPIGKIRQVGNFATNLLGKAKSITGFIKKGKDFVSNIPVIGDAINATPIGGIIDQVDRRVGQVNDIANNINNKIQ